MTRIKRGKISLKRRRNVLKQTKGFKWGRKSKERFATEALLHAYTHSFHDRKKKKGTFRRLWNNKINAAIRLSSLAHGKPSSYSQFIHQLKQKNIILDRKVLALLAEHYPKTFATLLTR